MVKYYEEYSDHLDGENTLHFRAVADKPRSVFTDEHGTAGKFPVAEIEVAPPRERMMFDASDYSVNHDLANTSSESMYFRMKSQGYSENEIHKAVEEQYNTPQMFYHEPAEVIGLYADPSMRHTVGTLGGLAINQFGKLRADSILSDQSSRLVRRFVDSGLVEPHPLNTDAESNITTNLEPITETYDVESPTNPNLVHPEFLSEVSKPRVDQARKTIHGMLRPKTSSEQFGPFQPDPQLPGTENY